MAEVKTTVTETNIPGSNSRRAPLSKFVKSTNPHLASVVDYIPDPLLVGGCAHQWDIKKVEKYCLLAYTIGPEGGE